MDFAFQKEPIEVRAFFSELKNQNSNDWRWTNKTELIKRLQNDPKLKTNLNTLNETSIRARKQNQSSVLVQWFEIIQPYTKNVNLNAVKQRIRYLWMPKLLIYFGRHIL
jgi:hypothetical protein